MDEEQKPYEILKSDKDEYEKSVKKAIEQGYILITEMVYKDVKCEETGEIVTLYEAVLEKIK